MGRGQRHSKNAGIMGSEALTYHERKALGFGTVKERVGKVSWTRLGWVLTVQQWRCELLAAGVRQAGSRGLGGRRLGSSTKMVEQLLLMMCCRRQSFWVPA